MTATDLGTAPNPLDVSGEHRLYRALRNFWHPVAYSSQVDPGPVRAELLGEAIVVARLEGRVVAFPDLCLHRGSALSLGRVEDDCLRCAYHGWAYDAGGRCVDVPARRELSGRINAQLNGYQVTESTGLVWVCPSGEPRFEVPSFPLGDIGRTVTVPVYDWNCNAARRVENYVDFSHFPFVHDGVLASRDHPEVPDHEVTAVRGELRFEYDYDEPLDAGKNIGLGEVAAPSVLAHASYRLFMPFTVVLDELTAAGDRYVLFFAASPVGPRTTRNFTFMARDYDFGEEGDRRMLEFNDLVVNQDRAIVESQRPEELPTDLAAEMYVKGADAVAIRYRSWLVALTNELVPPAPASGK